MRVSRQISPRTATNPRGVDSNKQVSPRTVPRTIASKVEVMVLSKVRPTRAGIDSIQTRDNRAMHSKEIRRISPVRARDSKAMHSKEIKRISPVRARDSKARHSKETTRLSPVPAKDSRAINSRETIRAGVIRVRVN